jgi:predicted metalloprotease with PDZ domain
MNNRLLFFIISTLSFFSPSLWAQVEVTIKFTQPEHHLAEVTQQFNQVTTEQLIVKMPVWRTGKYQILPLANGVSYFSANAGDKSLIWHKIDKASWLIEQTKGKDITISYQLYANELGSRTRHIDDSHAFLDASAAIMYSDDYRHQPFVINLITPNNWQSFSGLPYGKNSQQFIAPNYDVLVDSPIETGINQVKTFTVDNREYQLVVWGDGNYDINKMVADLTKLVAQAPAIWSSYPFDRYVFMVHATNGERGATEHLNSTIIQRDRFKYAQRKDYLGFLKTAAHEFVHTWNVKQYRPEGLVPYDYQQENYAHLIWLSEGSTSYFQSQLLLRADLMSTKEFYEDIAKRIEAYKHRPGRLVQSVAESSFDHWIEQGGDYSNNFGVNIYSEGYMVSWLLDIELINSTNGKVSYRDVHNKLYQDYRIPHAFTELDILTILKQLTGRDYSFWWQKNVHGTPDINVQQLLDTVGLTIIPPKKAKAWSGIKGSSSSDGFTVRAVEKDSPAWNAGITTGDIIVAVDGLRLKNADLASREQDFKPSQTAQYTFFRRDKLQHATLTFIADPANKLSIKPVENATKRQQLLYKAWTGIALKPEKNSKNPDDTE